MDHHSLLDDDGTPSREHENVFGDEFEIPDFDVVVDGFRPNEIQPTSSDSASAQPTRTISAHYASSSTAPIVSPERPRNSTRKSRPVQDPFLSPEDEEASQPDSRNSLQFEPDTHLTHRSISSASSHVYAQTHSPRLGASGPSHPYGMYPQGTIPRSPSVTTASTARPSRRSLSQRGPQHPYAMYPQGVEDEDNDEDDDRIHQNLVQVGFPGLGANYTRRNDPNDEDQDIIGDYGHAEQLPPYTRYPDQGPEKMPLLVPSALHSRAPVAGSDPTMPLMHTALQPSRTPQSMTDDSALEREGSMPNLALIPSSSETTDSGLKKSWKEKSWKERGKTRFCRIPCWWILIAVCVITFVLAVLGGMLGGFVAGRKHAENQFPTITVVTSLYDASIIASPTSQAPPTGTFALTLSNPTETQCACLTQASQAPAWDCDLVPNQDIGIVVTPPQNGNSSGASIFYAAADQRIFYGAQAWSMNTGFAEFLTVMDNDNKQDGPAFYFQQYYDKIVVVPENAFNASSGKIKRGDWHAPNDQVMMPNAGDKPWFCVWNSTFLEGFIYVEQPQNISTSSSMPPATTSAGSTDGHGGDYYSHSFPSGVGTPITTTVSNAYTTATFTGDPSNLPAWTSGLSLNAVRERVGYPTPAPGSPPPPGPQRKRGGYDDDNGDADSGEEGGIWAQLPPYPFAVKLEERRLPNNPVQPYCQQYQILWNLAANWVQDSEGKPIIVQLEESDPSYSAYQSAGLAGQGQRQKRTVPGGCHCQWMSGGQLS